MSEYVPFTIEEDMICGFSQKNETCSMGQCQFYQKESWEEKIQND